MTGLAAVRGDRRRPRRDQRRDLLQRPAQRARRHVEPVGSQRRHDPVHRRPSTCFSYASRARNPAVNRPFGTGLAAGGAQVVLGPDESTAAGSGAAATRSG